MRNPASQGRPDANHAEIVKCYKDLYCSVFETHHVGFGFPDLIVGIGGITDLVEIKNEDGKLRASQELFIKTWRGSKVQLVRTEQDVIDHVRRVRSRFEEARS